MSALPPIATAKADIRKRPCPLYPQERTCAVQLQMSAKGQKRTSGQLNLFDHIVGAGKQRWRDVQANRLGSLEADHQFEFGRLLDRDIAGLRSPQNSVSNFGGSPEQGGEVWPVRHKTPR